MDKVRASAMLLFLGTGFFCLSVQGYDDQMMLTVSRQQTKLLSQLRHEWQKLRVANSRPMRDIQRPELTQLVGLNRAILTSKLGRPDFCLPNPDSCDDSPHWTYFFYHFQPPSAKTLPNGDTQITVTARGGWALEAFFFKDDAIEKALWVLQE